LPAVRNNVDALKYILVECKTPENCLEADRNNGFAFKYKKVENVWNQIFGFCIIVRSG